MSAVVEFLKDDVKRSVLLLTISAASLIVSFVWGKDMPIDPSWVAIILCGAPILWDAATGLILRHDIKADVLVAIAIVAAIALQEWFAAGEVALIMEIGGFLEDYSASKADKSIERLRSMSPRTGRVVKGDACEVRDIEDIEVGEILRVLPGESVPLDGRIVVGETSIDQSVITGESMPVDKAVGDSVFSGTLNQMGSFDMAVERTSEDSSFQRMVDMVSSVDADKTRMVKVADRWATWLVAIVLVLAIATYVVTRDVTRAVTVCIVFCPCAFILATPTAVVAAIGNLAKRGILVRDGDSLERMSGVDIVAFDKTGTMTEGRPKVVGTSSLIDEAEMISLVSSAESVSEHPLAKAFVSYADSKGIAHQRPDSFRMTVGGGIEANVGDKDVVVGNIGLMSELSISIPESFSADSEDAHSIGAIIVIVAIDGRYAGSITFSDLVRTTSKDAVKGLKEAGVDCILLTGDNERAASHIASDVGIKDFTAECRPETKLSRIENLQSEGHKVCMVGDGVNDALALKTSWVGISMGATGTDIATDASDMVLVKDGLESLPHLVSLSRRMMSKVRFNIGFSMCWNFLAVALSMMAVLGPVTGALVHNVGSVFVVVNSALLLIYGRK